MQTLNVAIIAFIAFKVAVKTQAFDSYIPKPDECGKLKEQYFYNEQESVEFAEYPWTAQILFKKANKGKQFLKCGGILISKRHLLTNGGCFADIEQNEPTVVVLGKLKVEDTAPGTNCNELGECGPEPQVYEIEDIGLYSYNRPVENQVFSFYNISVVRLARDVEFNDYVQPICLPPDTNLNADFATQYLPYVGYDQVTKFKRKVVAHIRSLNGCQETYKRFRYVNITENSICASCNNSVTLLTGSALMGVSVGMNKEPRFYLVGMMAGGARHCTTAFPDIFIKISSYLSWIKQNMV